MKKLSICIPTWNRADILNITLGSLINQLKGYEDQVELIVSDNNSEDNTEEIVKNYLKDFPLIYHRMKENIGGTGNFDFLINYLSTGEYSILIGNDDLVLDGAIPKILELISDSKYDYYYMNHCYKPVQEIIHIINTANSSYKPTFEACECYDLTNKDVEKWEEILTYDGLNPGINMLYIGAHLIKKEIWKENRHIISDFALRDYPEIKEKTRTNFSLYESIAMTELIIARAMMGKKCYYCGEPLIIQGLGSQELTKVFSQYYIRTRYHQIQHFIKCGIDDKILKYFKEIIDKRVLVKLSEIMNYRREQIYENDWVLEYIEKNISDKGFFEKLFDIFSDYNNNHYIKILKGIFNNELKKYLNKENQNIVLWGTGDVARSILDNTDILAQKINFVVDASIILHGKKFEILDMEIKSPQDLKGMEIDLIIISTVKYAKDVFDFIEKELKIKTTVLSCDGFIQTSC